MSDLLNQATQAASTAATTAVNTASNLASQATNLVTQAANSDAATNVTAQAKSLGTKATATAGNLAGQAHVQAHSLAPGIISAPGGTANDDVRGQVDRSHDLDPHSDEDKAKLEKLYQNRETAEGLQEKGILKGKPGDALAGKKADLERAIHKDALDHEIAQRPHPDELVKKGILNRQLSLFSSEACSMDTASRA
nr:hypothetical protein L203_03160 [Cryptococcus depauperatus CBS 7841]